MAANIKKGTTIFGVTGTYTSDANAAAGNILKNKTAYVNGSKITGTMTNKSGATVSANTVTESGTNALITIPSNGYYDTSSKISVPIETIKNEVSSIKSTFTYSNVSWTNTFNSSTSNWTLDVKSVASNYNELVLWETLFPIIKVNNIPGESYLSYSYNQSTGILTVAVSKSNTANGWMQFGIYYAQ